MTPQYRTDNITCPICGEVAVALESGNDNFVIWCANGHVSVRDPENFGSRKSVEVYNFASPVDDRRLMAGDSDDSR